MALTHRFIVAPTRFHTRTTIENPRNTNMLLPLVATGRALLLDEPACCLSLAAALSSPSPTTAADPQSRTPGMCSLTQHCFSLLHPRLSDAFSHNVDNCANRRTCLVWFSKRSAESMMSCRQSQRCSKFHSTHCRDGPAKIRAVRRRRSPTQPDSLVVFLVAAYLASTPDDAQAPSGGRGCRERSGIGRASSSHCKHSEFAS